MMFVLAVMSFLAFAVIRMICMAMEIFEKILDFFIGIWYYL